MKCMALSKIKRTNKNNFFSHVKIFKETKNLSDVFKSTKELLKWVCSLMKQSIPFYHRQFLSLVKLEQLIYLLHVLNRKNDMNIPY